MLLTPVPVPRALLLGSWVSAHWAAGPSCEGGDNRKRHMQARGKGAAADRGAGSTVLGLCRRGVVRSCISAAG